MSGKYDHNEIEAKWQRKWEEEKLFQGLYPENKVEREKKMYILPQLPYPSGAGLHVGHAEVYTACDIYARYQRMRGKDVLQVIGWDAFGLPAENFAIKTNIHPRINTNKAIDNFRSQIKALGISVDWEREVGSHNPDYYKWTQWFFLLMYKRGLAYRAEQPVNWCSSCKTVLANEQVVDGQCERCHTEVVQKMMRQWFLKITEYAERLYKDLDRVDWPEESIKRQRDWIGRSAGALLKFSIFNSQFSISTFTTRLDTLYGATALVIAPEKMVKIEGKSKHLALEIANKEHYQNVKKYIEKTQNISELERTELREKTGVFTGAYAVNPVSGKKIPVWVADYVVGWYGEGAIMLVPGHDERDYAFAKKYGIEIRTVIREDRDNRGDRGPRTRTSSVQGRDRGNEGGSGVFIDDGILVDSGKYTGMESEEARMKMLRDGKKAGWVESKTTYKLRDWSVSRQRFWGAPIPMVYCRKCSEVQGSRFKVQGKEKRNLANIGEERYAIVPVAEEELPVLLPEDVDFKPTGVSPLVDSKTFHDVECPGCGATGEDVRRESDTLDTFMCSSWYYYRYLDPRNEQQFASTEALKNWMPVDFYIGGPEHVTGHLLYSRFFTKVLHDAGYVEFDEPFLFHRHQGTILGPDGRRMSKRWGNVINPTDVVEEYGADTARMYEMFMGPLEADKPWDTEGVVGVKRFLERVWRLFQNNSENSDTQETRKTQQVQNNSEQLSKSDKSVDQYVSMPDNQTIRNTDLADTLINRKSDTLSSSDILNSDTLSHSEFSGLRRKLHQTIKKVTEDIEGLKFNTAIAAMMEFVNEVYKEKIEGGRRKVDLEGRQSKVENPSSSFDLQDQSSTFYPLSSKDVGIFLRLLAPFAPHLAEELWQGMRSGKWEVGSETPKVGSEKEDRTSHLSPQSAEGTHPTSHISHPTSQNIFVSIHTQPWPKFDNNLVKDDMIEFVIQVNGRVRDTIEVRSEKSEVRSEMEKLARESERVKKYTEGKKIKRTVFVPGKLINFVV